MSFAISLEGVVKRLGGKIVLDALSFHLQPGELWGVLGPSGSGKSVLLKHIIGLLRPDEGVVSIEGVDLWKTNEVARNQIRRKFGMAFQEGALFDSMNVFENVAFPLRRHLKAPEGKIADRVHECLDMVRLTDVEKKFPSELSTGMRRRVGFARAVALAPRILLFDEPTAGLDNVMVTVLGDLIRSLAHNLHATTIVVTHDLHSAQRIADKVAFLWKGKIAAEGTVEEFFKLSHPAVRQLVEGNVVGPLTENRQESSP